MTESQFARAEAAGALDLSIYDWGHCGPCYYGGRIVIRQHTLGG